MQRRAEIRVAMRQLHQGTKNFLQYVGTTVASSAMATALAAAGDSGGAVIKAPGAAPESLVFAADALGEHVEVH